ncbi:MAG: TIR domain-containing protein [Anaerolineae bacterium]|nr:TIR domain-containing protein [Anaerolineae bacterium]MBL6966132.1 TIR domain-containing protein [Anaerolineales bacterium]
MPANPYLITQAVTNPEMFFGRWELVDRLVEGLTAHSQSSFAIYGGRRVGKTSLMRMVQQRLETRLNAGEQPIVVPLFMDIELDPPTSAADFFERLVNRLAQWQAGVVGSLDPLPPIDETNPALSFAESFKELYRRVQPEVGGVKLAILIDESEKFHRPSWAHSLEDNLRSLLSNVPGVSGHIGLIMTGSVQFYKGMAAGGGGSPLRNVLEEEIKLPACSAEAMRELILTPTQGAIPEEVASEVIRQAGGHLFLGQYLMRQLWQAGLANAAVQSVRAAALEFADRRRDFESWLEALGEEGEKVYAYLVDQNEPRSRGEISAALNMGRLDVKTAIDVLNFHNLIQVQRHKYQYRGEMFRDWFTDSIAEDVEESQPVEIFISYAHEDELLWEKLKSHLASLRRRKLIDAWYDRQIVPGQEWAAEIDENINSAQIIILLISADFMESDYCYEVEMQRAITRHEAGDAVVIPVILRPTDWGGAPFSRLQALPKNAKPVTEWENLDRAFLNVVEGLRMALAQLGSEDE